MSDINKDCKKTCENCCWYEWDFIKEIMYCSNTESELYELEGDDNETCPEWEERKPVPPLPGWWTEGEKEVKEALDKLTIRR